MPSIPENVWIIADRCQHRLGRLWPDKPLALLPIAGRSILEYVMDELFESEIRQATLAISSEIDAIRNLLAGGARWGVELEETLTRGDCSRHRILADCGGAESRLLIYADRLRAPCLKEFLREADLLIARRCSGQIGFRPGSIEALGEDGLPLGLELFTGSGGPAETVTLRRHSAIAVDTPEGIHAANVAATTGRIPVTLHARELAPGVWAGRRVSLGRDIELNAPVFLGSGCDVGEGAVVGPGAILGSNCIVDEGVEVRNASVLGETYVGSPSALESLVARGGAAHRLTRPRAGTASPVLRRLDLNATLRGLASVAMRTTLALTVTVALPIFLLWLVSAFVAAPRDPFVRRRLWSNRTTRATFRAIEARASIPLRRLPWIFAVIRGDLDLLGIRPAEPASSDSARPWVGEILASARSGWLGPAALCSPEGGELETDLAEAVWMADRSLRSDLALLCRLAWVSIVLRPQVLPRRLATAEGRP
ncbi:MAG: NDP-sugar synthase [Thermoanaerobaculia bacterium]|nr:NDP-sugar synthase [Thermoanaerobaculia bacterium]